MSSDPDTDASTPRGRPRSFDLDEAIDVVLPLFWSHGYEATSLDQITAATGLRASSLYAAFGSKRGLFRAALDRYRSHVGVALDELAHGELGLDDVRTFLIWVQTGITSGRQPAGCLVVNTMVELTADDLELADIATSYRTLLRSSLEAALERAEAAGELTRGTADGRALMIQAVLFGAFTTGQAGAPDEAEAMLNGLLDEIDRWDSAER